MKCRKPAVLNEIKRAQLSRGDKILVIGSGIFPSTPLVIARELNVQVIGIDNNRTVVKLAQSYLIKKQLLQNIHIGFGDGCIYPVQDFDVVFVVINVWPVDCILNHLAQEMKPGSKLICRGIKNDMHVLFSMEKIKDAFSPHSFFEYPMFSFSKYPTTQSSLFIKK